MMTGFIDASGVDVDCEMRLQPAGWALPRGAERARDPRVKPSRACAPQAR